MTWLYQLWSQAYLTKRPAAKNAADWHDRWVTGVLRRLSAVMAECDDTCLNQPTVRAVGEP